MRARRRTIAASALARYLAAGGQEAEHVADIGLGGAKDQAISMLPALALSSS